MPSQFLSIETVIVRQMLGDGSILTTTTIARHSTSGREEATEDEHVTPNSRHLKPVTVEKTTVPSPKTVSAGSPIALQARAGGGYGRELLWGLCASYKGFLLEGCAKNYLFLLRCCPKKSLTFFKPCSTRTYEDRCFLMMVRNYPNWNNLPHYSNRHCSLFSRKMAP